MPNENHHAPSGARPRRVQPQVVKPQEQLVLQVTVLGS